MGVSLAYEYGISTEAKVQRAVELVQESVDEEALWKAVE